MNAFNLSGTLNAFRVLYSPSLIIPHAAVLHFSQIPTPLSTAFKGKPDIRAVVLDKDNCFAVPHGDQIHPSCRDKFDELRKAFPGNKLLIVSNSAGAGGSQAAENHAQQIELATKTTVLRHSIKKPGCGDEIMQFFKSKSDTGVTKPCQVAVIGDRLFTDVLLANMMGAHALWVRDGVVKETGLIARTEKSLVDLLMRMNLQAPRV